ncbi:MAG: hypothetical protein A2355_16055 [Spirochaetes bacterium RIFOXYB1_FULL_32_8]|nr:MAG: hypothetical protein A2355_16055 [Spirochaetes bacterium RIFOXYB1_FULL_32_8]
MKNILLLFILFSFMSCITNDYVYREKDMQTAALSGVVLNEEGLPVEGARVTLNKTMDSFSDINGKFLFNTLLLGNNALEVRKKDYTVYTTQIKYSIKDKYGFYVKAKISSLNGLLKKGNEYLLERKYPDVDRILTEIERINSENDAFLFLKAIYLYITNKYTESVAILEKLHEKDRMNNYYSLTLIKLYTNLKWYRKSAQLAEFMYRYKATEDINYLRDAAVIYKDILNDDTNYQRIMNDIERITNDK